MFWPQSTHSQTWLCPRLNNKYLKEARPLSAPKRGIIATALNSFLGPDTQLRNQGNLVSPWHHSCYTREAVRCPSFLLTLSTLRLPLLHSLPVQQHGSREGTMLILHRRHFPVTHPKMLRKFYSHLVTGPFLSHYSYLFILFFGKCSSKSSKFLCFHLVRNFMKAKAVLFSTHCNSVKSKKNQTRPKSSALVTQGYVSNHSTM